jgi:hypothetical protein
MTRRLRGCLQGVLCLLAATAGLASARPARAQDGPASPNLRDSRAEQPLFLRIRPQASASLGSGGSAAYSGALTDAEIARQARAAREAVWERAAARARIAIASVCTGCLKPEPAGSVSAGSGPAESVSARPSAGAQAEIRPIPASLAAISDQPVPEPATRGDP